MALPTYWEKPGWLKFELHRSSQVKRLWLQRSSSSPGEVNIIYKGDWNKYEIRLLNKHEKLKNLEEESTNEVIRFNNTSNRAGPFRFADFKNAWIEIIPRKRITVEEWFFETKNISEKPDEQIK